MVERLKFGRIAVDKYLDVRYGDENVFEYLGKDAYKAISAFLQDDYQESFRAVFEEAEYTWSGIIVKLKRCDDEYRDAYLQIRKQNKLVNGIQLWDINIYEIEALVEGYHEQLLKNRDYKVLTSIKAIDYFRYEHKDSIISFCRMINERERVLFSMSLEEWKNEAVYLKHVAAKDEGRLFDLCKVLKAGQESFFMEMETSLIYAMEEPQPCYIEGTTIMKDGVPYHTLGIITLKEHGVNADKTQAVAKGNIDPLTGLFSKKVITDEVKAKLNNSPNNVALFVLDVDNFKNVNDNLGHMFGDKVLAKVGEVISEVVGDNGIAGRIGGDEFMGMFDNIVDRADLKGRLRSLRSRIEFLFADISGVKITCSIGVCQKQEGFESYDELFACADKCLYLAKDKGKNRYIMYNPELHAQIPTSMDETKAIQNIIHNKDENKIVEELIIILFRERYAAIPMVLRTMVEELGFDRVSIYYGDEFRRIEYFENTDSELSSAFFANKEYFEQFDANGVVMFNNIYKIEEINREAYQFFSKQHTERMIQVLLGSRDNPKGLASFECCSKEMRFTDNMRNFVSIISKIINEIIEENIESE